MCTETDRNRALALVLLDLLTDREKLTEENAMLRAVLRDLRDRDYAEDIFPLDTCHGCGGPRGADGTFRHTTTNCPGVAS
jgi:hypothetical protein